jgi:hypothetical protein
MSETTGRDKKTLTGALVTLIAGLFALIANLYFFLSSYHNLAQGYKAVQNLPGVKIVTWLFPAMSDLIMISGIALLIAAIGYFKQKPWAFFVSLLATVIGLLGTWMSVVWPLMISHTPRHALIFALFLAVWFVLLLYVRKTDIKIIILATVSGIAMVLNFMNGVASLNKLMGSIIQFGKAMPLFVVTQQLNWIAAIAWGVFCVGVIYRKRWALIMGLGGGMLPLISGTPLAYMNSIQTNEISMFWIAPVLSLILFVVILIKGEKLWIAEDSTTITAPGASISA